MVIREMHVLWTVIEWTECFMFKGWHIGMNNINVYDLITGKYIQHYVDRTTVLCVVNTNRTWSTGTYATHSKTLSG